MFYYLYEITNQVNGKIYIGVHQTNDIDDGYMGSGTLLRQAIKKHGIGSFTKKILRFFDTADEMFQAEREIVTEEFTTRKDTYNINVGGDGGWFAANRNHNNRGNWRRIGFMRLLDEGINAHERWYHGLSDEEKKEYNDKISNGLKEKIKIRGHWWQGKKHSKKKKKKMHETHERLHYQAGSKNSQYGKHWWNNPVTGESKLLRNDEVPKGWLQGRKMPK